EAERLADDVAVIDHGTVIARGSSDELKRRVGGNRVIVAVAEPAGLARTAQLLRPAAVGRIEVDERALSVSVPVVDLAGVVPKVIRHLDAAGVPPRDVQVRHATLDDVFFALTGRAASPDDGA